MPFKSSTKGPDSPALMAWRNALFPCRTQHSVCRRCCVVWPLQPSLRAADTPPFYSVSERELLDGIHYIYEISIQIMSSCWYYYLMSWSSPSCLFSAHDSIDTIRAFSLHRCFSISVMKQKLKHIPFACINLFRQQFWCARHVYSYTLTVTDCLRVTQASYYTILNILIFTWKNYLQFSNNIMIRGC